MDEWTHYKLHKPDLEDDQEGKEPRPQQMDRPITPPSDPRAWNGT